ncbi:fasciclin domain-containing protein [Flavivirga jejuensis]|uniref:Fasciclin domain-containing protein n=1 Tax=Flavivirga jejuensis TaxID=870487 RepID=A0ABT8WKI1_9FLAO|nr:fasciclin domain-containing protein [Flavivirga jejuensis]MDO5973671.1 fasciclin domain-containing protein [Flavivirga jejuensis]
MKNINKKNFIFSRFIIMACIVFTVACEEDASDEHYEQLDSRLENNLLSVLSADQEYSTFVTLLEQTGYSDVLETPQAYTVWAPNNTALAQVPDMVLNDPDLLKQLIGNHISRFTYNSSIGEDPVFVKMLNNKYIEFSNDATRVSFGGIEVIEKDLLAANGILHTVTDVLTVKANIWDHLNENTDQFPVMMDYLSEFNSTVFDEVNSVKIGTNTLGQTVYDSIYSSSNSFFKTIGDLSSEEKRFTFIGLTDNAYADTYNVYKDYYQYPVEDSIKYNVDKVIFSNINFPLVNLEDLNGTKVLNTVDNEVVIDPNTVVEDVSLSNGNLFVVNQLDYNPKDVVYKPIRYEIENAQRREIGSLTDLIILDQYSASASGNFTNIVALLENPAVDESNNYFEIAFSNVLSSSYTIHLKFSAIGASQDTQLKFELSYVDENKNTIVNQIPPTVVSKDEDGIVQIGGTYNFPVYINAENNNDFFVKLKVIVAVSEPELFIYDRVFGIDYAELRPTE